MSEYSAAAAIVGQAAATMDARKALLSEIGTWAENNPYTVYGDRNDTLSDEQIDLLLESRQKFDEAWWEVEINASDYADWSDLRSELCDTFGERIIALYPEELSGTDADDLSWDDLPEEVQQAFDESSVVDCSDLLQTCLKHARCYMVATVHDPDAPEGIGDGDDPTIGPPHGDLEDDQNAARVQYLADKLGIDGWAAESCYWHESLKVMGQLDLREVYEKGKPTAITIDPHDNLIFHTSWNGSGCLGDVSATKTVTMPARFERDGGSYGIQAVYGFVGEVWRHELNVAKWEAWD
ncbi:hypothetical protein vBCbaSRXM_17 [Citromicrobium phage vB_CbaS-RXM]|nr:hypothetical protein vBCbaSRXM_17 [Citromicrobium phage vB_CbaS-RXM]